MTFDDLAAQLDAELRALYERHPSLDPAFRQAMATLLADENTTTIAGYVTAPMGFQVVFGDYSDVPVGIVVGSEQQTTFIPEPGGRIETDGN